MNTPPAVRFVTLVCADAEHSRRFLEQVLGISFAATPWPGVMVARLPGCQLAACPPEALPAGARELYKDGRVRAGGSLVTLELASEDAVRAASARAPDLGGATLSPPARDGTGGFTAWIATPEGHLLELSHHAAPAAGGTTTG